jgi:hypothetical protein
MFNKFLQKNPMGSAEYMKAVGAAAPAQSDTSDTSGMDPYTRMMLRSQYPRRY